jgi:hypothetical protein
VADPESYGVVDFDADGTVRGIVEKAETPPSHYTVTGLCCLDRTAPNNAAQVTPSARGELEITSLLEMYFDEGTLTVETMGQGYAWLDTGTHGSLLDARNFVRTLETRQGLQTGSPDEIAFGNSWITAADLWARADRFAKKDYGAYLSTLIRLSAIRLAARPKLRNSAVAHRRSEVLRRFPLCSEGGLLLDRFTVDARQPPLPVAHRPVNATSKSRPFLVQTWLQSVYSPAASTSPVSRTGTGRPHQYLRRRRMARCLIPT